MDTAAINIHIQAFGWTRFISLVCILRTGIWSGGSSVNPFEELSDWYLEHHFTFPLAVEEGFNFFMFWPTPFLLRVPPNKKQTKPLFILTKWIPFLQIFLLQVFINTYLIVSQKNCHIQSLK